MLFRPSRDRRGPDPHLGLKMILLGAGGAVAVAGFMLEIDWLVGIAALPLLVGIGLNLRSREGDTSADDDPSDSGSADRAGTPD